MGLIIAGDRSGVGKTTVTLGILAYLAAQGKRVQSFKVGPDYIDPMFHTAVTGIPCRNLDPLLTSPKYIEDCFQLHVKSAEWVVVEGVMGLFDGISHSDSPESLNDYGSTAHIARILNLPVLLVLDCSSLSTSVAAIAYGYANLDPRVKIVGVILNRVASDRHLELLTTALKSIDLPILGILRRDEAVTIPDRHLGLVPSGELAGIAHIFSQLADLAKQSFNWDRLLPLILQTSVDKEEVEIIAVSDQSQTIQPQPVSRVRIAVARDQAFNFYYQDNLDLLSQLGAELVFWSPLEDHQLPNDIHGLYFGGGFPEIFAQQLAANQSVLHQLKQVIEGELPTYAECGGLMYLCEQLIDLKHQSWGMVGIIPSAVTMEAKLTLGYRQAIALQDSPLIAAQQTVIGHEFHRSQLTMNAPSPQWQLQGFHQSSEPAREGWQIKQVHASYLHLHWGVHRFLAARFIQYCRNYKSSLY
jgi:cobyrinic acid a,c-diamide synthase